MISKGSPVSIPDEVIVSKIYLVRGVKVMLDRDLADLYGIDTKALKQSVRRNNKRFPLDFMFEMSTDEFHEWRSQFVTSKTDRMGLRYPPFCFSEHGVLMLSSVLNSDRAIDVNIQIIRIFTKMRQLLSTHKDILLQLELMEQKIAEHDHNIILIFEYIKELEKEKLQNSEQQNRKKIGFKR
jgi:hypothetical protein